MSAKRRGAYNPKHVLKCRKNDPIAREKANDVFAILEIDIKSLRNGDEKLQCEVEVEELRHQIQTRSAKLDAAATKVRPVVMQCLVPESTRLPVFVCVCV